MFSFVLYKLTSFYVTSKNFKFPIQLHLPLFIFLNFHIKEVSIPFYHDFRLIFLFTSYFLPRIPSFPSFPFPSLPARLLASSRGIQTYQHLARSSSTLLPQGGKLSPSTPSPAWVGLAFLFFFFAFLYYRFFRQLPFTSLTFL